MKIVLIATALLGTILCFMGFTPFSWSSAGAADRVQTIWYTSGQVQSRAALENGVREGSASEWYPNGQERCSGEYRGGLREGTWVFFKADGTADPERSGNYSGGVRTGP
jgi:antitoxin component YwqK of YwqJK toxin-antitoxin module